MNIELSEDDRRLVIRSLTRSIYDLQSCYRRNVNTNRSYAASLLDQIKVYAALYTRLSGSVFVFDLKTIQDAVYGQVKLELV